MAGFLIQIDGSSIRNPGPAGIGVRILGPDGSAVREISHSIGIRTNNQAEYEALICALKEARHLPDGPVKVRTDSELLYYQMHGKYKVKNPELRLLYTEATRLLTGLPRVTLELVRREANHETDRLAKAAARSHNAPQN
jgi:ribonuclease HI